MFKQNGISVEPGNGFIYEQSGIYNCAIELTSGNEYIMTGTSKTFICLLEHYKCYVRIYMLKKMLFKKIMYNK